MLKTKHDWPGMENILLKKRSPLVCQSVEALVCKCSASLNILRSGQDALGTHAIFGTAAHSRYQYTAIAYMRRFVLGEKRASLHSIISGSPGEHVADSRRTWCVPIFRA